MTLASGQTRDDVDFGYTGAGSVGDTIFLDLDGDGNPSSGQGLAGVTVDVVWSGLDGTLDTADDLTYSATTNSSRAWAVSGLPASLIRVIVDTTTVPAGLTPFVDPDGAMLLVTGIALLLGSQSDLLARWIRAARRTRPSRPYGLDY